jgi:hypothetical protein
LGCESGAALGRLRARGLSARTAPAPPPPRGLLGRSGALEGGGGAPRGLLGRRGLAARAVLTEEAVGGRPVARGAMSVIGEPATGSPLRVKVIRYSPLTCTAVATRYDPPPASETSSAKGAGPVDSCALRGPLVRSDGRMVPRGPSIRTVSSPDEGRNKRPSEGN